MLILGHGVDLVGCARIAQVMQRHGSRFLDRVFTPTEQDYCQRRRNRAESLAGRFAAKEAILKALGTGWRAGIAWTDMEVVNDPAGRPHVHLHAGTARCADRLGVSRVLLSISHSDGYAVASAIAVSEP